MRNLEIRECKQEDLQNLQEVLPAPKSASSHKEYFDMQLKKQATYLIAQLDRRVVGHLAIFWDGPGEPKAKLKLNCPELVNLEVNDNVRGLGIGSALVLEAEKRIREAGFGSVCLVVSKKNVNSKKFYKKLDFYDSRLKYEDVCFLAKKLAQKETN